MTVSLDKKDFRILYALEKNGRATLGELAKAAGISKQLAGYKLHRMEREKVIEGYHAIIDTSRLGYTTYRIYLRLRSCTRDERDTMLAALNAVPEVTITVTINGRWDVGFAISVKSLLHFHRVWDKIMHDHRERIAAHHVSIYSPIYHFTRIYLNPGAREERKVLVLGGSESVEHDDLDLAILRKLARDIRRPLTAIGRELGRPVQTVINRIRAMEQNGIIQGYRPMLNWPALGYDYYKADIQLRSHKRLPEMERYVRELPFIFQIDKTIGGSDLEIEIYARSLAHFREIMDRFQRRFEEDVDSYEYLTVEKTFHEAYMPA